MSVLAIPQAFAINIAGQCDRGKVRKENQDMVRHTSAPLGDLLIVAEGIGGSEASRLAVDAISSCFEHVPACFPPEIVIDEAIRQANAVIAEAAAKPDSPDSLMAAKVLVALLRTDAKPPHAPMQTIIGHVGDSRAYLVHNQKLTRLTGDHSTVQDLADSKQITPKGAEEHPDGSMPEWRLGQEFRVRVEMHEATLEDGDTLVLCSDGLWGYVPEQEIERILADGARSVDEASRALLNLALDAGGYDNVAIEIARLTQSSDSPAATPCPVEPQTETRPEIEPVCEFEPGSDTSPSDGPISQLILDEVGSVAGIPSPKRKNVLGLIRSLGKRTSNNAPSSTFSLLGRPEEDAMVEKPVTAEPAAPSQEVFVEKPAATEPAAPSRDAMVEKPAEAESAAPPVPGVQPTVSWATPEPIAYGTRLSSLQLNATASVEGKFVYTPGPGYVLPAGTHTLWVTFHAADSPEDNPVLDSVSITVSRATPSIQWPAPSNVPPGVELGAAQLNASVSVPGTFEYSPAAGEMLPEGTHTLSVTFIPTDKANYTTAQATVSIKAAKTVPMIDWTSPDPISFGAPLGPAELNASASVPGTFEYSPAAGEILSAGSHTLSVTFTPSDRVEYDSAVATVPLTVTRTTPALAWPAPERITYGAALSDTQLNATASAPGSFLYKPGPGEVLAAGEHTPYLVFTPENLNDYTPAAAAVRLSVDKATPAINWPAPEPINSATPLGSAQLNASASVPGTFTYHPAAGERLEPGARTLSVTFTPADCVNYTQAQATVSIAVTPIVPPEITWLRPASIFYGTALGDEQLSASSSVPGSFLYTPGASDVLPPGEHRLSVFFTPEDREKYAKVQAAVTLIVEGLPNVDLLLKAASQTLPASGAAARLAPAGDAELWVAGEDDRVTQSAPAGDAEPWVAGEDDRLTQSAPAGDAEPWVAGEDDRVTQSAQRETRTYKGAIYEKGDDGQWHLQKK